MYGMKYASGIVCAAVVTLCGAASAACSGQGDGTPTAEARQPLSSAEDACPVSACEARYRTTTSSPVVYGATVEPDAPGTCTYFEGAHADNGQWWSDSTELGWDALVAGAVRRPGTMTNRTCSRSQFAGVGSMPSDACAWKYLCVPLASAAHP